MGSERSTSAGAGAGGRDAPTTMGGKAEGGQTFKRYTGIDRSSEGMPTGLNSDSMRGSATDLSHSLSGTRANDRDYGKPGRKSGFD